MHVHIVNTKIVKNRIVFCNAWTEFVPITRSDTL